jgi:hypothetical protein
MGKSSEAIDTQHARDFRKWINRPRELPNLPIWKRQFLYQYGGFESTCPWNPIPQTRNPNQRNVK